MADQEFGLFLFARLHARDGQAEVVRRAIFDVQGPTRNESGCLNYQAFQSLQDLNEFFIHSRWRDSTAFTLHLAQPHTIRFAAAVQPLIDMPLKPVLTRLLENNS
jgi:quinol monooxygenase YgiN